MLFCPCLASFFLLEKELHCKFAQCKKQQKATTRTSKQQATNSNGDITAKNVREARRAVGTTSNDKDKQHYDNNKETERKKETETARNNKETTTLLKGGQDKQEKSNT
jgi:hypothetical protein